VHLLSASMVFSTARKSTRKKEKKKGKKTSLSAQLCPSALTGRKKKKKKKKKNPRSTSRRNQECKTSAFVIRDTYRRRRIRKGRGERKKEGKKSARKRDILHPLSHLDRLTVKERRKEKKKRVRSPAMRALAVRPPVARLSHAGGEEEKKRKSLLQGPPVTLFLFVKCPKKRRTRGLDFSLFPHFPALYPLLPSARSLSRSYPRLGGKEKKREGERGPFFTLNVFVSAFEAVGKGRERKKKKSRRTPLTHL